MWRWSCLEVFEYPATGAADAQISVHREPLTGLTWPAEAPAVDGESLDCLASPERFERGGVVLVSRDQGVVMGYVWLAFEDHWLSESDLFLRVRDDEAVTYDAFVFPSYRGRRLFLRMESAALAEAGRRGRSRGIGYVESENIPSIRTNLHLGTIALSLYSLRVADRFSLHWASGGRFSSRFYRKRAAGLMARTS
jgi:GNAT superfamily N-acetyltransferase